MEVKQEYVIGVDFGTDSVRSIIVNSHSGEEITSSSFQYPRWKKEDELQMQIKI